MVKIGTRVNTENGFGIVVEEEFRGEPYARWGVELDNNPFSFPVAYYFKKEVEEISNV